MSNSANTQQQQGAGSSQQPQIPAGNRRWQRDNARQQNYVLEQDWKKNKDWNSQTQIEQGFEEKQPKPNPGRQQRNRRRAQNWKKTQQQSQQVQSKNQDFSEYKSQRDVGVKDEPLYDIVAGSRPIRKIYSQNLDFSGFPLLCETVHREMKQINPRLKREMPFCSFLHAMTTCLNAWLFRTVTELNSEDRYSEERDALSLIPSEMLIPQPISEYLSMINTVVTQSGDTVKVNVPDDALPGHSGEGIPPGSFGEANAATHNAYECYVSPLVTRNFLIASKDNNADYKPLPDRYFPENTKPTRNLLGYYPVEILTPEGRAVLDSYVFPDTDDMAGRLQVVPALLQEVSNSMLRMQKDFKMIKFHEVSRKPVQTGLIFAKTVSVPGNANQYELARTTSNVHGPYAFGNVTASQAVLFSLKRDRVAAARGLCYVKANNTAPDGWAATVNSNFQMLPPFLPTAGVDGPQFRADSHQAFPPDGLKENFLTDWLKAFKLQKPTFSKMP